MSGTEPGAQSMFRGILTSCEEGHTVNLQHLRYFQAVAREGNYFRASQKLFVTQPALSRAITNLENELGFPLFERVGRRAQLTACGRTFLDYVEKAMNSLDQGIDASRALAGQLEGVIPIACIYGYVYSYLPLMLHGFLEHHPSVHFSINPCSTREVLSRVNSGEAAAGICIRSAYMEQFQSLEYMLIHKERIVVIASKKHPLARQDRCLLSELSQHRIVSFGADSGLCYKTKAMFSAAGLPYEAYIKVTDDQSVINVVRNNLAVACVLQNTVSPDDSDIAVLEIADQVETTADICLTIKKRPVYSVAVSAFVEYIISNSNYNQAL